VLRGRPGDLLEVLRPHRIRLNRDDRCGNLSEPVDHSERRGFTYSQSHYQEIICELPNFEVFLDDT
jgi:hypothetical protein